ncbi:amino acid ABC transporter substrate-binding protein (PAAT family) [Pseudodesulfovibrio indicus]|uniref:Amino acid ABC transporter substrate-binding protein (PAAT family) n=1 Tax=Pseudodesulfovibrio indicus TaxID=1716143 RepID=A0AA94PPH3_9BACT|nr:amino acid ABC transporter substrate-binding protein (PAAT family) [Pseudodesulfovibrio indicus]
MAVRECGNGRREVVKSLLRRSARVLFSALLLLSALSSVPAAAGERQTIHLAAFDYPPFYMEERGQVNGIAVELGRALFNRLDLNVEFTMYPLKRALSYLQSGEKDGVLILIRTPERERYAAFTDPVMTVRGLIWSSAEREGGPVNFDKLEDLRDYTIGVTLGYSYGERFDEMLENMRVDTASTDYANYRKLLSGRIDIFPGNEIVARGLFRLHPELRGKFDHSERSFMEWVLCMGVSRKSPFLPMIPEINKALADMRDEGLVDEIVGRYTR